jgi:hypothetical protein
MIVVTDWISRLQQALAVPIGGSREAAADFGSKQVPNGAVYVTLMSEDAEPNTMMDGLAQEITATVTVWTAVHNFETEPGDNVGDAHLQDLRSEILSVLLGWSPEGCEPVEYAGGSRVSGIDMGLLLWEDSFVTRYPLRAGC